MASNDHGAEPDVVMACCGDVPTLETLAAVDLLRHYVVDDAYFQLRSVLMADEAAHPGRNNNAFCQDNEISWFDWRLVEKHADVHRFVQELIALRMNRDLPVERLARISALDARAAGFAVAVTTRACCGIDLDGSLDAAMRAMAEAGVALVD